MLYYPVGELPSMPWVPGRTGLRNLRSALAIQGSPAIPRTLALLSPGARICDLGSGGRRVTAHTVTVDRAVGGEVDLCSDLTAVGLQSHQFDLVICTGTLEHVPDPDAVIAEIRRLLKPGGLAHIEVPFIQGYHPDPGDYWRWTLEGLRLFLSRHGFSEVASGIHMGPVSALNWVIYDFMHGLFGRGWAGKLARGATFVVLAPWRFLDAWMIHRADAERIPSGVYFVGRTP